MNKRINFSAVQRLVKNVDIEFAVMVQHSDGGSWGDLMVGDCPVLLLSSE